MGRPCSVCAHPRLDEINIALAAGRSYRDTAVRFGPVKSALLRHAKSHLPHIAPRVIEKARGAALVRAEDILTQLAELQASALAVLAKAEETGDIRGATGAITTARGNLELIAKLLGELREGPVINLVAAPEWTSMRDAILVALQPFPEARIAVAEALSRREALGPPEATSRALLPAPAAPVIETATTAGTEGAP